MLGVGITENVIIANAQFDPKTLWLTVSFKELLEKEFNPFEALGNANEVEEAPNAAIDIKFFNPKVPKAQDSKGNTRTEEQLVKLIQGDINRVKGQLLHLLKGYLTKDQINFDLYRGTGIDQTNFFTRIKEQAVLDLIQKNMCEDFVRMIQPFLGDETLKFRLLLVRTSKDKHFATMRDRYLEDNPIWESMDIPKDASKVKFSAYEIREGLNDGTPASRGTADKATGETSPADVSPESVFGG